MTKIEKKFQLKFFFVDQNRILLIPRTIKDVQATGDVFILTSKRTSSTSKLEFSSFLWVILALLDPDPANWIQNTKH
jgi:hypothetical protein